MPDVESLKLAFSTNTTWAEYSTIAVFVGLLGDIIVILAFDLFDPDKSWWEIGLVGVASLVIALGVLGEWRYGHLAGAAANRLQTASERRISELNREARQLGKDAETAKGEQERLKRENLALEQMLLPRRFAVEMSSSSTGLKSLKNFAGTKVAVVVVPDVEAIRLAKDIAGALNAANWQGPFIVERPLPASSIPDGVEILTPDIRANTPTDKAAFALSGILRDEYMETGQSSSTAVENRLGGYSPMPNWWPQDLHVGPDTLCIFVGMKPIEDEIGQAHWMEQIPERARKWFKEPKPYTPLPLFTK